MTRSFLLPEERYDFINMNEEELEEAYNKQLSLTGKVEEICEEWLKVLIGHDSNTNENIYAILPFDEVTIYGYKYSSTKPARIYPLQICTLLSKKIRIVITKFSKENGEYTIYVSRKKNMEKALELTSECVITRFLVKNMDLLNVYGDIGDGIIGRVAISEVSNTRLTCVADVLHVDDMFWGTIMSVDSENRFELSYKAGFKEYNENDYKRGDCLTGIVSRSLKSCTGYLIHITPQVSGIMDITSNLPLVKVGSTVECIVRSTTPRGLKLEYVKTL